MNLRVISLLLAGALVAGCAVAPRQMDTSQDAADARQKVLKQLPPAPKPPPVPEAAPVALDPALRERAKLEIITAAKSSDPVLRANAMEAAQESLGAEAGPLIMAGLEDQSPVVQFAAAMAAGTLQLSAARPQLLGLVDHPNEMVRIGVRYALHKLGDYRRSHELEQSAVSPDPRIRGTTAMALGLLGEKSAVKVLRPMRRDMEANVRLQVAEALWRLGDEQGFEKLAATVISQFPDDQMIAVLALAAPRDIKAARPYVRGKLTTSYDEVNLVAARAMGMLGSDEGYSIATKGTRSADPRQRHLAALALGAIGRSDAQPVLAGLMDDAQASVRLAAAMAILQLKPPETSSGLFSGTVKT